MHRNRARIFPAILFILLLAGRSSGARLRVLMAEHKEEDKPNSPKVPTSPTAGPLPKSGPSVPAQNPSPAGDTKSDPKSATNPPPQGNPPSLVPPPAPTSGGNKGQDKQDKAPPKSQESGKEDKQNKSPPSGLENKAPPGPKGEERGKQDKAPGRQENNSPPSDKNGENGKKDKVPPSGPQTKNLQNPEGGEDGKRDKTPPSGPKTKDQQGKTNGGKDEAPPSEPKGKDQQGPKSGEHNKQEKNSGGIVDPGKSGSPRGEVQEDCDGATSSCKEKEFGGCLHYPGNGSKKPFLRVYNTGENVLNVTITAPPSIDMDTKMLELARNDNIQINFSTNATENIEIILDAGKGHCTLQMKPPWIPTQLFSAYATHLTQIYGVYLLFFTFILAGGTWACCKFGRKRRRTDNRVPYQQLEMGTQPPTVADGSANTADGWDEVWDDDWGEEEAAPRPLEKHLPATVSSNGLTLRSPSKDGWDMDWDD